MKGSGPRQINKTRERSLHVFDLNPNRPRINRPAARLVRYEAVEIATAIGLPCARPVVYRRLRIHTYYYIMHDNIYRHSNSHKI